MPLDASLIVCRSCGAQLEPAASGEPTVCGCGVNARYFLFPAVYAAPKVASAGERLRAEGEASCYLHEKKRATAACENCGRFVCDLCRIEWGNKITCPVCLNNAGKKSDELVQSRPLPDTIALLVSVLSIPLFYLSLFSAPVALFLAIRSLKKPNSIVPRTRARAWIAIVLALLQIVGWTWLIVYFILRMRVK